MKFIIVAVLTLAVWAQGNRYNLEPGHLHVSPIIPAPIRPKIVGGEEAAPHQFPHQVGLIMNGILYCSGTIIDANTILTSALCSQGARNVEVIAGAHLIRQSEPHQQRIVSNSVTIHEGWNPIKDIANDIGLIHLPTPLTLNEYVQPIALRNSGCADSRVVGVDAIVSGWGRVSDSSGSTSPVLRWTKDRIVSNAECTRYFGDIIRGTHICLSGLYGNGICSGDAGGPLTINNELVGIVSVGVAGCEHGYPNFYTRISCYVDWINSHK